MSRFGAWLLMVSLIVTAARADTVAQIRLPTNDLVYDPFTQRIYASVPGRAGQLGNSIVAIDPMTGAIGAPIRVGSDPGKVALSNDGQYLYAALEGAGAVRRVHLPSRSAGLQFPVGYAQSIGPYFVADMEVVPGQPESVAIARKDGTGNPSFLGVAIYDNGVPRRGIAEGAFPPDRIEFSASASRLYGFRTGSPGDFYRLSVDRSGISILEVTSSLLRFDAGDIRYDDGWVYADAGRAIDPESRALLGTFAVPAPGTLVAPDATVGRVFFLVGVGDTRSIVAFDRETFVPVGSLTIRNVSGKTSSLIRWGIDGLAFRTDQDQVFLIRTALVPSSNLNVSLHPVAVVGGRSLVGRITLAQPAPAGGALVALAGRGPAEVPATVLVPAGSLSATFPVRTSPVGALTRVEVTATLGSSHHSAVLTVLPSVLVSLTFQPEAVLGSIEARGTLTVNDPPAQDLVVSLSSANPSAVRVPATVTIPAGAASVSFSARTFPVAADATVAVTATSLGMSRSGSLKVLAADLKAITLQPGRILGGTTTQATVTLTGPAPAGGATVRISTKDAALPALVSRPFELRVPAGATSAGLTITSDRVKELTAATVAATYDGVTRTARVIIVPMDQHNGPIVRPLTDNGINEEEADINDSGHVVWISREGAERYVTLWDDSSVRRLSEAGKPGSRPRISESGHVLWEGNGDLFLWDGKTVHRFPGPGGTICCAQMNAVGQVVWLQTLRNEPGTGSQGEVFLWDGTEVRRVTQNRSIEEWVGINRAGQIVWSGYDGHDWEVYLWTGSAIRQLTDNQSDDRHPDINDAGQVVWDRRHVAGYDAGAWDPILTDVYLWDGGDVRQLSEAGRQSGLPQINNAGQVTWTSVAASRHLGPGTMHLWTDGMTKQIAENVSSPLDERYGRWSFSDTGQIVWWGWNLDSGGLYVWTGSEVRRLTQGFTVLYGWEMNALGQVAWSDAEDRGVLLWDGKEIRRLSNTSAGPAAINRAGQVVWPAPDGTDTDLFLYSP